MLSALLFILLSSSSSSCSSPTSHQATQGRFLQNGPCNLGCWSSFINCTLLVSCGPSSSSEIPVNLNQDQLSSLLTEASGNLTGSCSSSALHLELTETQVELNVTEPTKKLLRDRLWRNGSELQLTVTLLNSSSLLTPVGSLVRHLGAPALVALELTANQTDWAGGEAVDFENHSIPRLHLRIPAPAHGSKITMRNLRAGSLAIEIFNAAAKNTGKDRKRPKSKGQRLELDGVSVTGQLTVSVHSNATGPIGISLNAVSAAELRLAGHLTLALPSTGSPHATSLTSMTVVESVDEPPAGRQWLVKLHNWAPGLQTLNLAGNSRLARGVLEDSDGLQGLLTRKLLPELQLLDLRGCDLQSLQLAKLVDPQSEFRCSEIHLFVDANSTFECHCGVEWLVQRCFGGKLFRWCSSAGGENPVQILFANYLEDSCRPPRTVKAYKVGYAVSSVWVVLIVSVAVAVLVLLLAGLLGIFILCKNPGKKLQRGAKRRDASCSSDTATRNRETESCSDSVLMKNV